MAYRAPGTIWCARGELVGDGVRRSFSGAAYILENICTYELEVKEGQCLGKKNIFQNELANSHETTKKVGKFKKPFTTEFDAIKKLKALCCKNCIFTFSL